MSIQSTVSITRKQAISRIREIHNLVKTKNFKKIYKLGFDPHESVEDFVNNYSIKQVENIEYWTDTMLDTVMDLPFFRYSVFENYIIEDTGE